jgi:class 3 adenylate cyclase
MQETSATPLSQSLTASELQAIDQFRRQKSTAVLTILFTDIKGFTRITEQHGEAYSNKLRKFHDDVIVPVIERDGGGRVIKHIGDAVMAVFSEPSTAVARSIEAQEKLAVFNKEHPEFEDINVRMGLHCGQVTTEDDVNADVFGRHVNRAARVEALADGGQVLVTYTVFDSARGWLNDKSDKPVSWEKYGRYELKGIPEPVEIYEAYNPKLTQPKKPAGAMKSKSGLATAAAAVLAVAALLAAGTYAYLHISFSKPEVSVIDYNSDEGKLEDGRAMHMDGERGQHVRNVLVPLEEGKHLLTVDISYIVRAFAPFEVKAGKNVLDLRFERVQLPGVTRRVSLAEGEEKEVKGTADATFISFDKNMARKENTSRIELAVKAEPDPGDAAKAKFTADWTVMLNGVAVSQGTHTDSNRTEDQETRKPASKILWSDDYHYYYLSYYMSGNTAEFSIESSFIDYKDK